MKLKEIKTLAVLAVPNAQTQNTAVTLTSNGIATTAVFPFSLLVLPHLQAIAPSNPTDSESYNKTA
ncbi:hypothetical protein VKT23_004770 [Stygiomarasmius scandens]|uniref:Uncharacterized protein n=1 Tax=Marasmiellus scandens TaxID=2682957 RepID=A0ABR1JZI4_9AGAR